MAWIADTYMNLKETGNRLEGLGVVTGKPLAFGGSQGREKATGQGLVYVLDEVLPPLGLPLDSLTFSLIGYGNVGSWTGRLLGDRGAALRAVLDHTGALYRETGIDAVALAQHVKETGGVAGFAGAQAISEDAFYATEVDLFIPAALEQMIDGHRADQIRCKVLAEAANAPVTPEGERRLVARDITILPAILCNVGGVTVSYFEWKQNRQAETWDLDFVDAELKKMMQRAAQRVLETAAHLQCSLRQASYAAALEYIQRVYHIRGIFP
jgi:glutamate dehydrogenase (NAD(P)+)